MINEHIIVVLIKQFNVVLTKQFNVVLTKQFNVVVTKQFNVVLTKQFHVVLSKQLNVVLSKCHFLEMEPLSKYKVNDTLINIQLIEDNIVNDRVK